MDKNNQNEDGDVTVKERTDKEELVEEVNEDEIVVEETEAIENSEVEEVVSEVDQLTSKLKVEENQ